MADDEAVLNKEFKNKKILFKFFPARRNRKLQITEEDSMNKISTLLLHPANVFLATTLADENTRVGRSEPLSKTTYRVIKHGSRLSHIRVCPFN